uniref:Uncharacterized protein n=2 Tax=Opuntia streptacantha TaxID=393608 RepID=A0A7C8YER7_OPUST
MDIEMTMNSVHNCLCPILVDTTLALGSPLLSPAKLKKNRPELLKMRSLGSFVTALVFVLVLGSLSSTSSSRPIHLQVGEHEHQQSPGGSYRSPIWESPDSRKLTSISQRGHFQRMQFRSWNHASAPKEHSESEVMKLRAVTRITTPTGPNPLHN